MSPPPTPHRVARRRALRAGGALAALLGAGCLLEACTLSPDQDHAGPGAPAAMPLDFAQAAARPRVAWVFSSGGPRGFVHVGVCKALAEIGVQPDLLVGASVGSLVATLCAAGTSAADLEQLALDLSPLGLGRLAVGGAERLSGSAIADLINSAVGGKPLQGLQARVACVAAPKVGGRVVAFTAGDAGLAVQASCAIEGQFTPVRIRGVQYVDPDAHAPLPVRLARSLGAQRVLSVDASAHEDQAPAGAERYRQSDLKKRRLTEPDATESDLHLHPYFGYWVSMSREFRQRAIQAGYEATLAQATRIRQLHKTSA